MNSQNRTFVIGGLIGSVVGLLAVWLYVRAAREEEAASLQAIPPGKMVKLGLSIMEVLRQVTALGEGEEERQKRGRLRRR